MLFVLFVVNSMPTINRRWSEGFLTSWMTRSVSDDCVEIEPNLTANLITETKLLRQEELDAALVDPAAVRVGGDVKALLGGHAQVVAEDVCVDGGDEEADGVGGADVVLAEPEGGAGLIFGEGPVGDWGFETEVEGLGKELAGEAVEGGVGAGDVGVEITAADADAVVQVDGLAARVDGL